MNYRLFRLSGPAVLLFFCLSTGFAPRAAVASDGGGKGVKFFEGDWKELLKEARRKNMPFWVDFWASWCGPCRQLNKTTFRDREVAKYSDKTYIAYKMDIETPKGQELSQEYGISSIPAIFFFNPRGKVLGKVVGYHNAQQFLAAMQKYAPEAQAGGGAVYGAEDYVALKEVYFQDLRQRIWKDSTEQRYFEQALRYGQQGNLFAYEDMRFGADKEIDEDRRWWMSALYHLGKQDYEKYIEIVNPHFEADELTRDELHWLAWQAYPMESIPHEPMRWINQIVRQEATYERLDTKAALLMQDGKTDYAEEIAEKARDMAQKNGQDDSPTQVLLTLLQGL